ncbi:MAG: division/cell wall cluster transcriptional repressor MraZ [Nocardioides sp.]
MFLGTFNPKIDDKGRLFLPAKFRDRFVDGLVVAPGQERCLNVWRRSDFEESMARYMAAPVEIETTRRYMRLLSSHSWEDVPDRQGRITLTPKLREWAGLDRDIAVIGVMNRLEIWNRPAWERFAEDEGPRFAELSEDVFPRL